MSRTRLSPAFLCALLSGAFCCLPGAAQNVRVTRIDGAAVDGKLLSIDKTIELETSAGALHIDWNEMMSLRPSVLATSASQPAAPLRFVLADDSAFSGQITGAGEQEFTVAFFAGSATLDARLVRTITVVNAPTAARRKFEEQMREDAAAEDTVVVGRGEDAIVLRGVVKRIEPTRLIFNWNNKDTPLPWERLAGVRMAKPTPRGASCLVVLRNGDALAGRVASADGQSLTLRSGALREVNLDWAQVESVDWRSDKLVYLSALKPARYEQQPMFGREWPYQFDRSFSTAGIHVGAREFPRGVVMHSRSRLTFDLGRNFDKFAATAGIVDEMKQRGCVAMRVLGDGRVLWEARGIRGGQPPRDVAVSVRGVEELALEVDYDDDLDLSDQAAWAAARLIRSEMP